MNHQELVNKAKGIPKDKRLQIIKNKQETDIHFVLEKIFQRMEPDYTVQITHGVDELGKDLVLYRKDELAQTIIGVVVKKGDIKAKTLSDVDIIKDRISFEPKNKKLAEIISQIRQAGVHPGLVKTSFEKLKINNHKIIIVGDISQQARERMSLEIPEGIGEIHDLEWLIDKSTNYYPEVFFDEHLLNYLSEQIKRLEDKHVLNKKNLLLSDVFVDPIVSDYNISFDFTGENISKLLRKEKYPFNKLEAVLRQNEKILLVGEPGIGKSGCLSKIALDEYKNIVQNSLSDKKENIEIPILIPALKLLSIDDTKDLLSEWPETLEGRIKIKVLLLDALDEVALKNREAVIEKAEQICNDLDCALLITSRNIDILNSDILENFKKYELQAFNFKQAMRLVEKLCTKNKNILENLRKGLNTVADKMPLIPMSLMLLVDIVEEQEEIPASITELYQRYIEQLLGRWDKDKGIEVLFEYYILENFISEFAYEYFYKKHNSIAIDVTEFTNFLDEYAERHRYDLTTKNELWIAIERLGVFSVKNKVTFCHRSFLDYFVAKYIHDKREEFENLNDMICDLYYSDFWQDVAFFYFGMKKSISNSLINKIFDNWITPDKVDKVFR